MVMTKTVMKFKFTMHISEGRLNWKERNRTDICSKMANITFMNIEVRKNLIKTILIYLLFLTYLFFKAAIGMDALVFHLQSAIQAGKIDKISLKKKWKYSVNMVKSSL